MNIKFQHDFLFESITKNAKVETMKVTNEMLYELTKDLKGDLRDFKSDVNQRFDAMDRRFETVDQRFDAMDRRFETIDQRFDAMDRRFDGQDARFEGQDERHVSHEKRFDSLENELKEHRKILQDIHESRDAVTVKFTRAWALASFAIAIISGSFLVAVTSVLSL